ncbi:MAG: repeat-containing protein [Verrucomicrobiales bacterium]|nr:repeat-containing protein [Verrucomicrobiales bacterium]
MLNLKTFSKTSDDVSDIKSRTLVSFLAYLTVDMDTVRAQPWLALPLVFQLWMLIDAVRRQEYGWAVWIFVFPLIGALCYYIYVYRAAPSATVGFELPGVHDRRRIKQLQAQIHHLDKPHHHLALGDIYFQKGKLDKAEACYRASLERDPSDIDTRAHLGQCLLRQKKPDQARLLLQQVCTENPRHDYGHSLMAYAETLAALGDIDASICAWKQVLENNSYARARVQLAQLYITKQQPELARPELQTALADDVHAPAFQRKRDRVWIRRAKSLLRSI